MSTKGLVHNDTFDFDGTNYHLWRIRMLCHFRAMGPNALRIVLVGISNAKDGPSPSFEDMYLDCDASLAIHQTITIEVFKAISTCKSAHEAWTKLEDIYGGSNLDEDNILWEELMKEFSTFLNHEEVSIASTSNYLDTSTSSTSPTCGVPQGNDMVSEEISCDDGVKLIIDDLACVDASNVSSMDLSISSTTNSINYCVDSPCISPKNSLKNVCGDMLAPPCCHDRNALVSSSCSITNHVEEIKKDVAHLINEEPSYPKESSSTPFVHMCLMARGNHEVSSSLSDNDDDVDDEEDDYVMSSKTL